MISKYAAPAHIKKIQALVAAGKYRKAETMMRDLYQREQIRSALRKILPASVAPKRRVKVTPQGTQMKSLGDDFTPGSEGGANIVGFARPEVANPKLLDRLKSTLGYGPETKLKVRKTQAPDEVLENFMGAKGPVGRALRDKRIKFSIPDSGKAQQELRFAEQLSDKAQGVGKGKPGYMLYDLARGTPLSKVRENTIKRVMKDAGIPVTQENYLRIATQVPDRIEKTKGAIRAAARSPFKGVKGMEDVALQDVAAHGGNVLLGKPSLRQRWGEVFRGKETTQALRDAAAAAKSKGGLSARRIEEIVGGAAAKELDIIRRSPRRYTAIDYLPAKGKTKAEAGRYYESIKGKTRYDPSVGQKIPEQLAAVKQMDPEARRLLPKAVAAQKRIAAAKANPSVTFDEGLRDKRFLDTIEDIYGGLAKPKMPSGGLKPPSSPVSNMARRHKILSQLGPGSPRKTKMDPETLRRIREKRYADMDARAVAKAQKKAENIRREAQRVKLVQEEKQRRLMAARAAERDAQLAQMQERARQAKAQQAGVPAQPPQPVAQQAPQQAPVASNLTIPPRGAPAPQPQMTQQQLAQAQASQQQMANIVQSNPAAYSVSVKQPTQVLTTIPNPNIPMASVGSPQNMQAAQAAKKQIVAQQPSVSMSANRTFRF